MRRNTRGSDTRPETDASRMAGPDGLTSSGGTSGWNSSGAFRVRHGGLDHVAAAR